MKYNEWRDELYNNLLSVSETERRRVLDYYAEAYADRRDAGFSEREIIDDFGAPYDAARRILSDGAESEKTGDYGNNENLRARRDERRENYGRNDYRNTDYAPSPRRKATTAGCSFCCASFLPFPFSSLLWGWLLRRFFCA